jgi:hypothetical protein
MHGEKNSTTIFAGRNAFSGSWFPGHPGFSCIHSDAGFGWDDGRIVHG